MKTTFKVEYLISDIGIAYFANVYDVMHILSDLDGIVDCNKDTEDRIHNYMMDVFEKPVRQMLYSNETLFPIVLGDYVISKNPPDILIKRTKQKTCANKAWYKEVWSGKDDTKVLLSWEGHESPYGLEVDNSDNLD